MAEDEVVGILRNVPPSDLPLTVEGLLEATGRALKGVRASANNKERRIKALEAGMALAIKRLEALELAAQGREVREQADGYDEAVYEVALMRDGVALRMQPL